ncbi:hypothetical protein RhiirA5_493940 [Rhizophagus irregularis]|uniref:Uncharacterized protein n=3 Tax=Rhizophagus irregularis TaxID=588596 RepID=A0A2I1EDF0_9GLOM|nr:hypothetical protein GLOIN_2v1546267 [Rhizophagus irregularis DAOM 181602=DAOM 197198]EXX66256.1 hypothetical protein RirG_125660 [Rhizophagus irregularis DAOM 197198w]PKC16235.1 hypothetical protein RhiirA5_493940 [Rhizophagus irregularis]PKC65609.1 hypothetical protein RhiirA1_536213 [Rhizophagus irregularis]PKK70833.1 hypothetical protein RhiirC2_849626 [Rhizophagus irregularis]PKY20150.1 hypothetical protein RhiirB3_147788 [Rhizophagus irregularis]|eukprot:XP_025184281.1 hypothetical protein GLOIN_2v1546267 [Rhizophagus irregularis DAOM 181602=DAOM 197198]
MNCQSLFRHSQIIHKENKIRQLYDNKLVENHIYVNHKLHYDLLNYIAYLNYFIQILKIKEKKNNSFILKSSKNFISLTEEAKNIYFHLKDFKMPLKEIHNYYGIYIKADKEFDIVIEDLKQMWRTYNNDKKRSNENNKFCDACYHLNLELSKLRITIQVDINRINLSGR